MGIYINIKIYIYIYMSSHLRGAERQACICVQSSSHLAQVAVLIKLRLATLMSNFRNVRVSWLSTTLFVFGAHAYVSVASLAPASVTLFHSHLKESKPATPLRDRNVDKPILFRRQSSLQ